LKRISFELNSKSALPKDDKDLPKGCGFRFAADDLIRGAPSATVSKTSAAKGGTGDKLKNLSVFSVSSVRD
jgi:hypothetical protein